jgi:hypothetical protein
MPTGNMNSKDVTEDPLSDLEEIQDEESSDYGANRPVDPNDDGELLEIDGMKKGFSFSKYVDTVTKDDKWIEVSEDYIPTSGDVKDCYVVARCNYLGLELTLANKDITKGVMTAHQHSLRGTYKEWIQRYWVELCQPLGITYTDLHRRSGRAVSNFNDFQCAVRQIKTEDDAKKIATCLYISFDFIDNFRKRISRAALRQHGLRLVPSEVPVEPPNGNDPAIKFRRKKDCFERLASQMLTDQRKNINRISFSSCRYTFTKTRPTGVINDENEKKVRRKKCFYPWMVMGELVRKFLTLCVTCITMSYANFIIGYFSTGRGLRRLHQSASFPSQQFET